MIPYGWTMERLRAAPGRGSSHGLARLRDGVSFEQAADDMTTIAAQLEKEVPQRNTGWSVTLVPVHEQMVDQIRPALLVLAGAVLLVLLIACVNVANLLLARSTVRQRELGLRTALGAGRGRLLRQMLTESLLLVGRGRRRRTRARRRVPSRAARARGRSHSGAAARSGRARPAGGGVHDGARARHRLALRPRPGACCQRHGERRACAKAAVTAAGPRSRRVLGHAGRRRSGAFAGAARRRRTADSQLRSRCRTSVPGFRPEGVLTARVQLPGVAIRRPSDDRRASSPTSCRASPRCQACRARQASASCRSPGRASAPASIAPINRSPPPAKRRSPK